MPVSSTSGSRPAAADGAGRSRTAPSSTSRLVSPSVRRPELSTVIPGMSGAPGGSAGSGHGSDPDEEALQRRIREFLRHGSAAEAGVEEWGEFAAQLRFLREELPLEERQALLERWDRMLSRALPDLQLAAEQRESVLLALEAAAAEGTAWAAFEDRMPLDQGAGLAPVLRPSVWTLDRVAPAGNDEDDDDHEDDVAFIGQCFQRSRCPRPLGHELFNLCRPQVGHD